jgi:glycosyltransferase involved in cell wall biosynthesis
MRSVRRILQVCNTDFYLNRFLAPLVLELAARGHEVECACEGGNVDARLLRAGIRIHHLPFPRASSPLAFWAAIRGMRDILCRGGYDCVDSHNRNASLVARIAAWLERVPLNLYTAHGFYFHDGQSALIRELTVWLEAFLAQITHFTFSQSAEDIDLVVRRGLIAKNRIVHIGNGIDTNRFAPRFNRNALEREFGLKPFAYRIATTGRIVKGKGFEDLLHAFARLRSNQAEAELLIIGGNIAQDVEPFQVQFRNHVTALGVQDCVRITGMVDQVPEYLATADVFVLPSYREGMPRSLIEAMAMELPCIATDIRGSREIISDGHDGLMFRPGDVHGLVQLLERCVDPSLRATLGRRAREKATRQYSEVSYVERQVTHIEALLSNQNDV